MNQIIFGTPARWRLIVSITTDLTYSVVDHQASRVVPGECHQQHHHSSVVQLPPGLQLRKNEFDNVHIHWNFWLCNYQTYLIYAILFCFILFIVIVPSMLEFTAHVAYQFPVSLQYATVLYIIKNEGDLSQNLDVETWFITIKIQWTEVGMRIWGNIYICTLIWVNNSSSSTTILMESLK